MSWVHSSRRSRSILLRPLRMTCVGCLLRRTYSLPSGWGVQWETPAGAQREESEAQVFILPPSLLSQVRLLCLTQRSPLLSTLFLFFP